MAENWEKEQNKLNAMAEYGYSEKVVSNPNYFDANTGKLKWDENAPSDGAVMGTKEQTELQSGDKLIRYDTLDGSYFAPADSKYEELGLPYDESKIRKSYWKVDKPFTVEKSKVAPAFDSEGGGIQYRLNSSEDRVSQYNKEHTQDVEAVPRGSFRDSPSNLAYEGFIHEIDEKEAISENHIKQDVRENDTVGVRDMLKGMGHEFSPLSAQTQEKYSETENPSPTHVRDMLKEFKEEEQVPEPENENENE